MLADFDRDKEQLWFPILRNPTECTHIGSIESGLFFYNFTIACRRLRIVFSVKDFSTSRAVGSGISSTVVSGKGTICSAYAYLDHNFAKLR